MMKIEKSKMQAFLDAVGAIAPECRVWLKNTGIETRAVDAANVAMVSAKLPKNAFTEYDHDGKMDVLGFDVRKLKTAIGMMRNGVITIEQGKTGKLEIADGTTKYSNALLDINTIRKDANPPNITLPATITITGAELHEAVSNSNRIGDKTRFSLERGRLTMTTEGDTDMLVKEIDGEAVNPGGPYVSQFSGDYLREISKELKGADKVKVSMSTDHPIRFEAEIDGIEVEYLVAPRIEAD